MATRCGMCVRGGMSRLFNKFINTIKPKSIITYADLRYSDAHGYRHLGFIEIGITKPGYFYYKGTKILSRQQCQKNKLNRLLPIFDQSLSESTNMFANGYRRVWDAGHLKLILNLI
jgi:hypothetical protein